MAVFFDIVGSVVFFGILLLTIFVIMGNLNQANYEKTYTLNMQTNAVTLARIMEYDMLKIGYHVGSPAIISADSTSIQFVGDLENDGDTNTVSYYIGSTSESVVADTKNPRDRMIYRVVNGQPAIRANLGLTDLKLTYFDSSGVETNSVSLIRSIGVKFRLENFEPVYPVHPDVPVYPGVFWEKRIFPRNI